MYIGLGKVKLSGCGGMADAQDSKSCGGNQLVGKRPTNRMKEKTRNR